MIVREPVLLRDGDAFLLCTDGFWGRIESGDIEEQLRFSGSVEEWLEGMRVAVTNGYQRRDNYNGSRSLIGFRQISRQQIAREG